MSHATVALSPATQLLINAMMPAMAVGAAGFAVTAGAVMASRKLRCDYETAKSEFEERCRQDEAALLMQISKQATMSTASSAFGAIIEAGSENTTLTFLQRALSDLAVRAQTAGRQKITEKAAELSAQVSGDSVRDVLESYFALSDQLDTEMLKAAKNSSDCKPVLSAIRAEIDSPVLAGQRHEKLRIQFDEQLTKLESIGDRNASLVRQAADNLKARVRREISQQNERQAAEIKERKVRRDLVAEAYALVRAVMQGSDNLDEKSKATALLGQLGAAFQAGSPPTVSELEALLGKARSLFATCEKRLDEAATHAFVAESVKDVLLNMGYQVSEVPPEVANGDPGCMVSIDTDSGVVVSLAPDGRMVTEMVAFTADGQHPDEAAEKRVCSVVDDILAGLRQRDIPMLDKSRKKLRPGHKLRMVKKNKQQELAAAAAKSRAVE